MSELRLIVKTVRVLKCKNTTFYNHLFTKKAFEGKKYEQKTARISVLMVAFILLVSIPSQLPAQIAEEHPLSSNYSDNFFILLQLGGYLPIHDSYKINYETKTIGLPLEIGGGLLFPVSERASTGAQFRFKRREAVFVPDMSLSSLEIEPMVHYYLEKPKLEELRLYGLLSLLLARTTVTGIIESTTDGTTIQPLQVSKGYYNIGFGIGLGLEYPIATLSAIYADLHLGTYFADGVTKGGLGNIGGITMSIGYKLGL